MKKLMSLVTLVIVMAFSLNLITVFAEVNLSAEYSDGAVAITGSGFDSGRQYTARIVNTAQKNIVTLLGVDINADGELDMILTTGALSDKTDEDYMVYINDDGGALAAQCQLSESDEPIVPTTEPTLEPTKTPEQQKPDKMDISKVTLSKIESQVYTGKANTPAVVLTDNGTILKKIRSLTVPIRISEPQKW